MVFLDMISVCRISDQTFYKRHDGKGWYTFPYYQMEEISHAFGAQLGEFTAFGRILQYPPEVGDEYKIPSHLPIKFDVDGPIVKKKGAIPYGLKLTSLIYKLWRDTKKHDINWCVIPTIAGLISLLISPKKSLTVVHVVGEWDVLKYKYPRYGRFVTPMLNRFTIKAISKADMAIYVSNYLSEKYGGSRTTEVFIVNESRLRSWMINEIAEKKLHHPIRVLYAGRFAPGKGLKVLAKAFSILLDNYSCELWLLGEGDYKEELRNEIIRLDINHRIIWLGWASWGEELFKIMKEADIFVLPSFSEGCPLSIIDALANGLPIVASAVGGILDIIENERSGLLFKPGDYKELAACIMRIINEPELRSRLIINGLGVARDNTFESQTGAAIGRMLTKLHEKRKVSSSSKLL